MARGGFKDRSMSGLYTACRDAAADNWSEMYLSRTTAGINPMGPNMPRRGAGHRCAYWDGRQGVRSLYSRAHGTLGYAAWAAGRDDARRGYTR